MKKGSPAENDLDAVFSMLSTQAALSPTQDLKFNAALEFQDYFPGKNVLPKDGDWIMVTEPPPTQFTVPPMSIWFASPWTIERERFNSHRVKIVTKKGDIGLFPREYSRVDPSKFLEFVGTDMELKFFGNGEGIRSDALFYIRSRGISLRDAIMMILGSIKQHGVCWIETRREVCESIGKQWPHEEILATI